MPISISDFKNKVIGKIKDKFEIKEIKSKHIWYEIYYQGNKICKTFCSHGSGSKEIYDEILSKIKRQMYLDKTIQIYDLRNCPMTAEDYLNLLRQKNVISD